MAANPLPLPNYSFQPGQPIFGPVPDLARLNDVQLGALVDNDILAYSSTLGKWTDEPATSLLDNEARTMHVSPSWTLGADSTHFTTISAAITAALALTPSPSAAAPVLIKVEIGTYTEVVTMRSFVVVSGANMATTVINGSVNYAPSDSISEGTAIENVTVSSSLSIVTSVKSGGDTGVLVRSVICDGTVTIVGRPGAGDGLEILNSRFSDATFTMSDFNFTGTNVFISNSGSTITLGAATTFDLKACRFSYTNFFVGGTSEGTITSSLLNGSVSLTNSSSSLVGLVLTGSTVVGGIITTNAGSRTDVRACNFGGNANLTGAGTYLRDRLDELDDVSNVMVPNTGDVLRFDGFNWTNSGTGFTVTGVINGAGFPGDRFLNQNLMSDPTGILFAFVMPSTQTLRTVTATFTTAGMVPTITAGNLELSYGALIPAQALPANYSAPIVLQTFGLGALTTYTYTGGATIVGGTLVTMRLQGDGAIVVTQAATGTDCIITMVFS